MKYRKDGRTYKTKSVFNGMYVGGRENSRKCYDLVSIETIPSKILNWLKGVSKTLKSTVKVE